MPAGDMIVNALTKKTAVVIFSHGLGDTAHGWYSFAQSMNKRFPEIKWILPTAPIQPVSLNMGMPMNSWFDIKTLNPPKPGQPSLEDEPGMLKSVKRISDIVAKEIDDGVPSDRIVVGGFSQGAAISILTGLTSERKLAGVIAFSGWLAIAEKAHIMKTDHFAHLPIFMGHGTYDQTVQYSWGTQSHEKLKSLGVKNIEFHSYEGMAHSFCDEEQRDVTKWLEKVLPPLASAEAGKAKA